MLVTRPLSSASSSAWFCSGLAPAINRFTSSRTSVGSATPNSEPPSAGRPAATVDVSDQVAADDFRRDASPHFHHDLSHV